MAKLKTQTDIGVRWEQGVEHHPKSVMLYKRLEHADWILGGDALGLKSGGDGDNGEHLMYLLDVIFEAEDNHELPTLDKLLKVR